jgi:hypothetical protein
MAGRVPPRYVPTLTEIVQPPPEPPAQAAPAATSPPPPVAALPAPSLLSEEQIVHRVMQRIDLTLDRSLREAIAATVLEQTRLLGPLLREEIEQAVRQTVSQALAEELSAAGTPQRPG